MPCIRKILVLVCIVSAFSADAQVRMRDKKVGDIFPKSLKYKSTGWYAGPGVTYMYAGLSPKRIKVVDNQVDTFWTVDLEPAGKVGQSFEIGRYMVLEYSKWFKYMDYGLAYASRRGKEKWEENILAAPSSETVTLFSDETSWSTHSISGRFTLNNISEYRGKYFLQNSIGVNLDYNVLVWDDRFRVPSIGNTLTPKGKLNFQLHYKVGFGIKVKKRTLIIPTLETPIFNLLPFNTWLGDVGYFNSRYRTLIFGVRILRFSHRFERYFN